MKFHEAKKLTPDDARTQDDKGTIATKDAVDKTTQRTRDARTARGENKMQEGVRADQTRTQQRTIDPKAQALIAQLKVDPNTITPTGPNNSVTEDDVRRAASADKANTER